MAGITARIYTERVRREAALRGITLQNADIWSSQDSALQKLATDVSRDPERRAYAQTEVAAATLTVALSAWHPTRTPCMRRFAMLSTATPSPSVLPRMARHAAGSVMSGICFLTTGLLKQRRST
jgi:hypothetical protein